MTPATSRVSGSSSSGKAPAAPSPAVGENHPRPTKQKNRFVSLMSQNEDAADHLTDHQFLLTNIKAIIGLRGVDPGM